jgi:cell filamentation protein
MKAKSKGVKYLADGADGFQPGSRGKLLKNLLGITRIRDMEDAELDGYMSAERELLGIFDKDHRFDLDNLNLIHKKFLGKIYSWAGEYRSVNLSKGGFVFATAIAIHRGLMKDFEKKVLFVHTPCSGKILEEIALHIATVHVEFLLIHPYREGNGRTARLLATLMAYQAGLPGIDFGFIRSRGKEFDRYISAIQAGLRQNYKPMQQIILKALKRALRKVHH